MKLTSSLVALVLALGCGSGGSGGPAPRPAPPSPVTPGAPPAGTAPCAHGAATTPEAAALACYRDHIKPALAALDATALESYAFGTREYLASVLAIPPVASVAPPDVMPDHELRGTVALGARIAGPTRYAVVVIVLRTPQMPVDGDFQLLCYVDPTTLDVVYAVRRLGG